jgi:hypothetical protein
VDVGERGIMAPARQKGCPPWHNFTQLSQINFGGATVIDANDRPPSPP